MSMGFHVNLSWNFLMRGKTRKSADPPLLGATARREGTETKTEDGGPNTEDGQALAGAEFSVARFAANGREWVALLLPMATEGYRYLAVVTVSGNEKTGDLEP